MTFESDLPDDMKNLLDKWKKYATHKAFEESEPE
jgi:hypothetical protein